MANSEWRVLPLLRSLPEDIALTVFVASHIPLVAIIFALAASEDRRIQDIARIAVSAFLLIHAIAHWLSSGDPSYEFSSTLSSILIFGGAVLGAGHLLFVWLDKRKANVS